MILPLWATHVSGATLYYQGGDGAWDAATTDWSTSSALGDSVTWGSGDIAAFMSSAGVVTLGGPQTASGLVFGSDGFVVTGNTLTLSAIAGLGTSPVVNVASFQRAEIDSVIAGTSGLTKTGNGTLVLGSGSGNTISGDVVINGGALVITNQNQLGTGTSTISINGLANTGNPGLSGGLLVVQGGLNGITINRDISMVGRGQGALNNSAALISIGNNTFTGNLVVGSTASEGRMLSAAGTATVTGGVQLGTGGAETFLGNGNIVISGIVTGYDTATQDRFIKSGSTVFSTLWLQNTANNFAQPLRIDSGSVRVTDNANLGTSFSPRAVDLNGGYLEVHTDAPNFNTRNVYGRGTNGYIMVDRALGGTGLGQTVQFGNLDADNATFNFYSRNGYNLAFNGSLGAGTVLQWSGGANLTFNNNLSGTLVLNMSIAHDSETTQRTLVFGGNGDTVLTGAILANASSNAVSISKSGSGQLTLTDMAVASTSSGTTTISAGTLAFYSANALPTGQILIGNATTASGALTYLGAGETLANAIALNTTTANVYLNASGTGALIINGAITAVAGAKTLVLGGTNTNDNTIASALPSATTNLQKVGAGTWVLSGANAFTGTTTVSGGILKIQDTYSGSSRNVLSDTGSIIFNVDTLSNTAGGTLMYLGDTANNSSESVGSLVATAGAGTVQVVAGPGGTAALTFSSLGTISAGAGVNFVTNAGATVNITGASNTNGILNAHLFYNGADFAAGSSVGAATYTTVSDGSVLTGGNTLPYLVNTLGINSQTSATINAGIKFDGSVGLGLASGATLTLQNGAATVSGGILVTGGSSVTISGGTGITSGGAADLVFRTNTLADTLTLNTSILSSTTGGWTKLGAGTLVLGAANANTTAGSINIDEGTVQLSGSATLGANGVNVNLRQGTSLDLNGVNVGSASSATGAINSLNGVGVITNSATGTTATLRFGEGNATSFYAGLIQDGAGKVALVKSGTGTIALNGVNAFTGTVTILGGNLDVSTLANIGQASGIGIGDATSDATNAASLVLNGGSLRYIGTFTGEAVSATQSPSVSTDRLFTLAGNGGIYSYGSYGNLTQSRNPNNATLVFSNTGPVVFSGTGTRTLTLGGDSYGDNQINLQLINNTVDGSALTLVSTGGLWILGNNANSYTGPTVISSGALRADDGASLPTASSLRLNGGVLQTSGLFTRAIGTGAGQVAWSDSGTGTNKSGGFAASIAPLVVNLGGAGATVSWGAGGIGNGTGTLILSSNTSWADVNFVNPIDLNVTSGTVTRTIQVDDNGYTGLDYATVSGVISNSGAGVAILSKTGGGTLYLGDSNTYNGNTTLTNGGTVVTSIGAAGATSSSFGTNVGGGSLILGSTTNTVSLLYVGSGEVVTRPISMVPTTGTIQIDSSGSGPLVITSLIDASTNQFTLNLRGTNSDLNTITADLTDSTAGNYAFRIYKGDGGVWALTGNNTLSGGIRVDSGLLGLGPNSMGPVAVSNLTVAAAVSNSATITTSDTSQLKVGMNVNGLGIGYGDVITGITNSTTFTISNNRTITAGTQLIFGGLLVSNGEIFATDVVNGLDITQPIVWNNNSTLVFGGSGAITVDGAIYKLAGVNDQTLSNNLDDGALLTVNGAFINLQNAASATRSLNIRGYGSTVWNGVIQDNASVSTSLTRLDVRISNDATFTLSSNNNVAGGMTGGILLGQGTLIVGNSGALGRTANSLILDGGVLTSMVDLSGVSKVTNTVFLQGDPVIVNGFNNIEFGSQVSLNASRSFVNNLDSGALLTISGSITNTAAATLTLFGSGNTLINGNVSAGTGAQGLQYSGTGILTLTGANTMNGTLTVSRGTVNISGTSGSVNAAAGITLNAGGTLVLDNSGGNNASGRVNGRAFTFNGGGLSLIGSSTTETAAGATVNGVLAPISITGSGNNTLSFTTVNFANSGSSWDLTGISGLGSTNKIKIATYQQGSANYSNAILPRIVILDDFAAYDSTNGVVRFTAYNTSTNLDGAANADTMNVTGSANISASRTLNAMKINGSGLSITSTGNRVLTLTTGSVISTGGDNTLAISQVNLNGQAGYFQVQNGTTLHVTSALLNGQLSKVGGGTLSLESTAYFNSTTNVMGGTLQLNAGLNPLFPSVQQLTIGVGATVDLNGSSQYTGALAGAGPLPGGAGTLTNTSGSASTFITSNSTGSSTFAGLISGNLNLVRVGGNTLTLEMAQTYTGATVLMGGTTTLENDATLQTTSSIDINGAALVATSNSSLQTQNNDRIGDNISITLRGGQIQINGRVNTAATETLGDITLAQGSNIIQAATGGTGTAGAFSSMVLTIASLTRNAGTTVNFLNTSAVGSIGNNPSIIFQTAPTTYGDGILGPWAIVNYSDFAAYNTANGVGTVGNGGYAGYSASFGSGNITDLGTAASSPLTTTLSGNQTAAMLRLSGNFTNNIQFTNSTDTINLEMGGLLRSNNAFDTTIGSLTTRGVLTAGGTETSGARELIVTLFASGNPSFTNPNSAGGIVAGSPVVIMNSTVGILPGMTLVNANFPAGTTVVSVDSLTQITLSNSATASAQNQTFTAGSFINGTTTLGSTQITMNSTVGIAPGMTITGTGIPAGTYVVSVDSATQVTLSQNATANGSALSFTVGVSNMIVNSVIADNGYGNMVTFVKSGSGVLNLSANNTYSGGTIIDQGTVNLIGSGVVIPAGGITINNAALVMNTNNGQIDSTNDVSLVGSSTLTLAGGLGLNNTLNSISFNNNGGSGTPTVNIPTNSILTLTSNSPVTVLNSNAFTVPTISGGFLALASGANTFSVQGPTLNGQVYTQIGSSLSISSVITGAGSSIIKTDTGLLQLSGQSTFDGGIQVQGGGLILSASSTSTVPNTLVSGPLGIGAVSFANGTSLQVDNNRTVANAMSFAGDPIFNNTTANLYTMTLNGELSFATLTTTGLVVNIPTPYLNVVLGGPIDNIGSITSIGGTGANTISKTGLGNITGLDLTGIGSTVPINVSALSNGAFSILHDGDGTGSSQTINLGAITWEPAVTGTALTLTIGRAGSAAYYPQAVNKVIAPASLTSSQLIYGLSLTNNNVYGLLLSDNIAFSNSSAPVFTVSSYSSSLQTDGLSLAGVLSGGPTGSGVVTMTKAGSGVLSLTNAGNTFGGGGSIIDITGGVLSVDKDSELGNAANQVRLSVNATGSAGFRATDDITTSRTFILNAASNNFEVSSGKTLTLNSPFIATTSTNSIYKNDLGTLVLNADNTGWNGSIYVSQGVLSVSNANAFGSTTGHTIINSLVGQLQISGDITVNEVLDVIGAQNQLFSGIDSTGALRSVSGTNTWAGSINLTTASTADSQNRAMTITADAGSTLNLTGGLTAVMATSGSSRNLWFGFGGAGDINLSSAITFTGGAANDYLQLDKFGTGTLDVQVANAFAGHQVMVNQGVLLIDGNGSLGAPGTGGATGSNTVYVTRGGLVELDNSSTNVNNRLGNSRNIDLRGGSLTITGNSASATTETLSGIMTINQGVATIQLIADASQTLGFTTAAVTRNGGGILLVQASNLGSAAGAGVATIQATGNGYAFTGQTGATGSTNKSIIPWAIGDTNAIGTGIGFLTSNTTSGAANTSTNSLRLLTPSEMTSSIVANANVSLTSVATVTGSTTINSLVLGSASETDISAGQVLTLDSGGLIALSGNTGINGGILSTTSNRELILHTLGDLTISSSISRTSGGLTKAGSGTLTLTALNYYTGNTYVDQGTMVLAGGNNTIFYNNTLVMQGGYLDLNGNNQVVNNIQSQTATATNGNLIPNAGGSVMNSSATQATLGIVTGNVSYAGSIDGNIALVRSQTNAFYQDWNIYTANTYTGPTIINGGRIQLLGTSTLSNTSSIEISQSTLLISNNNATSILDANVNDRINDSAPILLRGGMLQYRARQGQIGYENFGAVTLAQGNSYIDIAEPGTGVNQSIVTISSLARQAGSHATLRFMNIDGQVGNLATMYITSAPALTNNIIGGWAVFERDFATYSTATGVGGLTTPGYAGYSPNLINLALATDNVRITSTGTTALTADRNIYSLTIAVSGATTLDLGAKKLNLGSGGLIASNGTDSTGISILNGQLTAGDGVNAADLYLHDQSYVNGNTNVINRTVTIGATITDNGSAPVTVVVDGDDGRGTGVGGLLGGSYTLFTASNTYSGGTFLNAGRLVLNNPLANGVSVFATGSGNLTITGGASTNGNTSMERTSVVQLGASSQLANTATVTMLGGSILDLNGFRQTLGGLAFNNTGGYAPTISFGATGVLTLNGNITASGGNLGSVSTIGGTVIVASAVNGTNTVTVGSTSGLYVGMTVSGPNITGTPTITAITSATTFTISNNANTTGVSQLIFGQYQSGSMSLNGSTRTITVDPVMDNGQNLAPLMPNLNITTTIVGTGNEGIIKAGSGLLQLSNQNTFSGGILLQTGGIILGASSTPTQGGGLLVNSPLGTGTLTVASGASLLVDNNSRAVGNNITFLGNPIFDSTGSSTVTMTLGGAVTLPTGAVAINVVNPNLTVILEKLANAGSVTSITNTGLGTLIFNTTGYTGDIYATALGNPNSVTLLNDGDGTGRQEIVTLGNVVFDSGIVPTVVVGRAGYALPYTQPQNKIIAPNSVSDVSAGLTVTNNNGYGLMVSNAVTLNNAIFSVANATISTLTQGLYLNGKLSGTGFSKTGNGTLALGNAANNFTGNVVVNQGVVSVDSDGELGNATNMVVLSPASGTATLRAISSFSTSRVIQLGNTANTRAIEVSQGMALQLDSAFNLNSGAGAAATLAKNDNGTLVLNADNTGWTGGLTINAGAVMLTNGNGAGSGTITISPSSSAVGAALQLSGGISVANSINLQGNNNQALGGINGGGQIESVSGVNTVTGQLVMAFDALIGADAGATLNINGGIFNNTTNARALSFNAGGDLVNGLGVINLNSNTTASTSTANQYYSIVKRGAGTLNITAALSMIPTNNLSFYAGTVSLNGSGTLVGGNGVAASIYSAASLFIDNTATNITNRLGSRAVTMYGGNLVFLGNAANASSETLGALTINRPGGTVTSTPGAGGSNLLTFSSLTLNADSAMNFAGTGLGTASNKIIFTTAPTLTNSILARATVNGSDFATYATGTGIAAFAAYDTSNNINSGTTTATLNLTANAALTASRSVNAIKLNGAVTISGPASGAGSAGSSSPYVLTISSGGLLATGANSSAISAPVLAFSGTQAIYHVDTGSTLTISSAITGTAGWVKDGEGTLVLAQTPSVLLNTGINTISGNQSILGGTVILNGGPNTLLVNQFLIMGGSGTLDLNGNMQMVRGLLTDLGVENAGGTVTGGSNSSSTLVVNQDNAGRSYGGILTGDMSFLRTGDNTLTLFSNSDYTGVTYISGGTTTLKDGAALSGTSAIVINSATLSLDNTGTLSLSDRINDAASITLNGGTLNYQGRAQYASTETFGDIILQGGNNNIFSTAGGTNVNSTDIYFGELQRAASSTATLRFNNLGGNGQLGNGVRTYFNQINGVATSNIGDGLANNIIGAWAIADREYATYTPGMGIGGLNAVGYATGDGTLLSGALLPTYNIRFGTTGITTLSSNVSINTLTFTSPNAATTLDLGGNTLNLTAGGILFGESTDNVGITITDGFITAGSGGAADLYLTHANFGGTNRTVYIDAVIKDNGGPLRVIKSSGDTSTSIMTLNAVNTYTGGTYVNLGTLVIGSSGYIPLAANPANGLVINGNGATVTQTTAGTIDPGNFVTIIGNGTLNLAGNNTLAGLVFQDDGGGSASPQVVSNFGVLTLTGGIVSAGSNVGSIATVAGRLDFGSTMSTLDISAKSFNSQQIAATLSDFMLQGVLGSSGGITKIGDGVLQLGQDIYTGPTVVQEGRIQINATNAGARFSQLVLQSGTSLNLNNNNAIFGSLSGSGYVINTGTSNNTLTVGFDNTDSTFSGQFYRYNDATPANVALVKVGTGTLTFDSNGALSTTTGAMTINLGAVTFKNNGVSNFSFAAIQVNAGGVLNLDNTGSANLNSRLNNGAVSLNGGRLNYLGANATASAETSTGALTLGAGASIINLVNGAGGTAFLKFGSLSLQGGSSATLLGVNLGTDTRLLFNTAPGLSNGIISRIMIGADFATYDGTKGLIAYTGYVTPTDINGAAGTATIKVDATTTGLSLNAARTVNAVDIVGDNENITGNGLLLPTQGWTLSSGGLLVNGDNATISTPVLSLGAEGVFTINGSSLVINGAITGSSGLTKAGVGSLTLSGAQAYTGQTTVNDGSVVLNGGRNTILVAPTLTVSASNLSLNGGTLDLNGNDQVVGALLNSNSLAEEGGVITNTSSTTAVLTTASTSSATFVGSITGNIAFTKSGNTTLALTDVQSYSGPTVIRGGTLVLQDSSSLYSGVSDLTNASVTVNFSTLNFNDANLNSMANLTPVRLPANVPVLLNGGSLTLTGGGTVDSALTVNTLTVLGGQANINLVPYLNSGSTATITIGNFIQDPSTGSVTNFVGYTNNNGLATSTLGGQGSSVNGRVILNQINGSPAPVSYVLASNTTSGSANITVPSTAGLAVGMAVTGTNIAAGTTIASIVDGTTITLSSNATATSIGVNLNINSGLTNNLIGGWAVADGNTFATYVTGYGVSVMGQTTQGVLAPGFDGSDITAATVNATQNINDAGTNRTISGNVVANSLRSSGGTASTFTIGSASSLSLGVGWITNGNVAYAITGTNSTSTLTSTNPFLYVFVNQNTTSIGANITGNISLVKSGGSILTLNNSTAVGSNTFTGTTYADAGTLNLSASAGVVVIPGDLVINNATVTMNTNAGQMASTGNLTINGGGVFNLVGANTLNSVTFSNTGGTTQPEVKTATSLTLSAATAVSAKNDNLNTTPTISGTKLVLSNAAPVINVDAGLAATGLVISAPLDTTGGVITKTGAGALVLAGGTAHVLTGGLVVNAGTLVFDDTAGTNPYGTGTVVLADGVAVRGGTAARTVGNAISVLGDLTFGTLAADNATANASNNLTFSGTVTLGGSNQTMTVNGLLMVGTISGQLTGGDGLVKDGVGTLVLSKNTNNYGGSTTVNGGTLQLGAAGVIPDSSALTVSSGGYFNLNGNNETVGSLAGNGVVTNTGVASTLTVGADGTDTTFSGQITNQTNALNLTKTGAGTQTLSGSNTYTGKTIINAGTLSISADNNLGAAPASVVADQLQINGGSLRATADVTIASNRGITVGASGAALDASAGATMAVGSVITGAGAISKTGAGTVLLNATNTNSGAFNVNAGTLGGTGVVGGDLNINSGGTVAPGIASEGLLTVAGNLTINSGGTLLMQLGGATLNDAASIQGNESSLNSLSPSVIASWESASTSLHDHLVVNGATAPVIDGTVKIDPTFLNGYTPVYGDVFNLLDWASLSTASGATSFDYTGVVLGDGLAFNSQLFASNGIIVVVPEPGRLLLLMFGMLGLCLRRRRRLSED